MTNTNNLEAKSIKSVVETDYADAKTTIYKGFVVDANNPEVFQSKDEVDTYLNSLEPK